MNNFIEQVLENMINDDESSDKYSKKILDLLSELNSPECKNDPRESVDLLLTLLCGFNSNSIIKQYKGVKDD